MRTACVLTLTAYLLGVSVSPARAAEPMAPITDDVGIDFAKPEYRFTQAEAAAGIMIEYEVVVKQDRPRVLPLPQGSAGQGITALAIDPSEEKPGKLIPFERISGGGHSYSLIDTGLPPPREVPPVKLAAGRYKHVFAWDGRNWDGGSDTSNPKGPLFPPGEYTLEVSCAGILITTEGERYFRLAEPVIVHITR